MSKFTTDSNQNHTHTLQVDDKPLSITRQFAMDMDDLTDIRNTKPNHREVAKPDVK